MKGFILGILFGAIIFIPVTALADVGWTKHIKNASGNDNAISVFDDADNKCYIVKGKAEKGIGTQRSVAISCVKR